MKKLLCAAASVALIFTAQPALAQMRPLNDPVTAHPDPESLFTSDDPVLHRNKQAALNIIKVLLEANQWDRAGEFLTDKYIQHNPLAASGLDAVIHYFTEVAKMEPKPVLDRTERPIVAVQAEGDFVTVLFVRELPVPGIEGETYTTTWFDTWRFVDGKADQHWDPATLPEPRPQQAAASGDMLLQQAKDRAEIEQLMWQYVRAADTLDADRYASVFTQDGSFLNTQGHDGLRKMITDLKTGQDQRRAEGQLSGGMHHVMSNQHIEFVGPDHARVHYYWQTVFGGPAGQQPPPNVAAVGRGVDDVVRVDGKWLIQSRNVSPTEG